MLVKFRCMLSSSSCSCPRLSAVHRYNRIVYRCLYSHWNFYRYGMVLNLLLALLFVSFCQNVMLVLGLRNCIECFEEHLLFIHVIFLSCSGQPISVPVHVCSTSPGKEVHGSLC